MGEYQYCEFVAIDTPLTPKQMAELRARSSRANITQTSFVNDYNGMGQSQRRFRRLDATRL